MQATFDTFWAQAEPVTVWTNAMLMPPPPHVMEILGVAGQVPAVRERRVFLAPRLPFGWIDAPPSINRMIGLRWTAALLYPERFPEDIRTVARDFYRLFYQVDPADAQLDRILAGAQPGRH